MDQNPYATPQASVADPVLVPVERPRGVLLAIFSYGVLVAQPAKPARAG